MKCVHCLNEIPKGEKEKDHLFPSAWYPDTTSTKVQRWTFPSCSTCNRAYGAIEEELLITIGMSIEPHYASTGISQKAINALDPNRAKNKKERLIREATLKKIRGRLIIGASETSKGVIPNFARREEQRNQCQHGLFIPEEHLTMLCRKFVKGVTWIANRHLIDDNEYIINSAPIPPDLKIPHIEKFWVDYSLPPGLIIKRVATKEDPINAIYFIMIWQQYLFNATCRRKDTPCAFPPSRHTIPGIMIELGLHR